MKRILFIAIAVLVGLLTLLWAMYRSERAERRRFEGNQSVLMDSARHYKVRDSLNAVSVQALNLTVSEYKRYRTKDAALIKDMGIKLKRALSATKVETSTDVEIHAPVQDSIIQSDNPELPPDTVQTFNWRDPWVSVAGTIRKDSVSCSVRSEDSLAIVAHRVPRKFLFIRWGTKAVRLEIVSRNPHTTIKAAEYVGFNK